MTVQQPLRPALFKGYSATVGADGTATVTIAPTSSARWVVTQVSVELATAPASAACVLRLNGFYVSPLIATGDAAGGDPPVTINVGDELTVEWSGCTPGQVGRVLVFYDEGAP